MAAAKAYAKEHDLKFVEVAAYPIWSNEEWGRVSVVRDGAASALVIREFYPHHIPVPVSASVPLSGDRKYADLIRDQKTHIQKIDCEWDDGQWCCRETGVLETNLPGEVSVKRFLKFLADCGWHVVEGRLVCPNHNQVDIEGMIARQREREKENEQ